MKFTERYEKLLFNARIVSEQWFTDLEDFLTNQEFYNIERRFSSWILNPLRKSYKDEIEERLDQEKSSEYYNICSEFLNYLAGKEFSRQKKINLLKNLGSEKEKIKNNNKITFLDSLLSKEGNLQNNQRFIFKYLKNLVKVPLEYEQECLKYKDLQNNSGQQQSLENIKSEWEAVNKNNIFKVQAIQKLCESLEDEGRGGLVFYNKEELDNIKKKINQAIDDWKNNLPRFSYSIIFEKKTNEEIEVVSSKQKDLSRIHWRDLFLKKREWELYSKLKGEALSEEEKEEIEIISGNLKIRLQERENLFASAVENYLTKLAVLFDRGKIENANLNDPYLKDLEGFLNRLEEWEQKVDQKFSAAADKIVAFRQRNLKKRRLSFTIEQFKEIITLVNSARFAKNAENYLFSETIGRETGQTRIDLTEIKTQINRELDDLVTYYDDKNPTNDNSSPFKRWEVLEDAFQNHLKALEE